MWICMNDSFISVVANTADDKTLLVRARAREHLARFVGPQYVIEETPERDYQWRAVVPREDLAAILALRAECIDYPNFKDSVRDTDLKTMYSGWWADHFRLQLARDYGNWAKVTASRWHKQRRKKRYK